MGQVVKLCNNLIYAAQMLATAEATVMAERAGVDLAQLYEILTHATGDCVAVIGFPERAEHLYNAAAVCAGGQVLGVYFGAVTNDSTTGFAMTAEQVRPQMERTNETRPADTGDCIT